MARNFHPNSVLILKFLADRIKPVSLVELKKSLAPKLSGKDFYNYIFRLTQQELILKSADTAAITEEGRKLLNRLAPKKDGVWKMVIFDIPEKHKYVRTVLRAKLKQLHFKKWQNSIWLSPYEMDGEIEEELNDLGKKFFVRLIKTKEINHPEDLEKMFGE
jgi:DNA-binding transcriptional regulator PaaX